MSRASARVSVALIVEIERIVNFRRFAVYLPAWAAYLPAYRASSRGLSPGPATRRPLIPLARAIGVIIFIATLIADRYLSGPRRTAECMRIEVESSRFLLFPCYSSRNCFYE